jgi:uncharacterized membrane protein YeiH
MDDSIESVATGVSLLGDGSVSSAMVAADSCEHCATMTTMPDAYLSTLILVLDLAGTFAFGLSGGLAAVRARLDLYGVIVLAGVVGLVGGIVRDVLLGALPPATFSDWRYLATVAASGLVAFFAGPTLERLYGRLNVFDAAGLSLFCVTGATKGLAFGVGPVQAVLLGVITATGGGMLRDVLVREVPTVLRRELYAVPALIGATVVVVASVLHHRGAAAAIAGAMVCFLIRMASLRFGLGLPTAPSERDKPDG